MPTTSIRAIAKIVDNLLIDHNIDTPPVNPKTVAEYLGINIYPKMFSDEVSGALVTNAEITKIVYNENHSENRQRFTIAHELGHFLLKHGRDGLFIDKKIHFQYRNTKSATGKDREEVEANAFAAALLMPERLLKEEFIKLVDGIDLFDDESPNSIKVLAKKFEVSETAMAFRLSNLKLI